MDETVERAGAVAPLLVGVTGKLDLKGAEDQVRAALDLAFDRLDARCPGTPKILLSSLARGADTVAAEAALARPDWTVAAPLPFAEALYLQDFDEPGAGRLRQLLIDPKVRAFVLPPLRRAPEGEPFADADLGRGEVSNAARTLHYEQAGLFIGERAALLIAVMEADEAPGKIGGSARIVRHRLDGELDAVAADIARRSDVLCEPAGLVDRRAGPVWILDLARLAAQPPASPRDTILVWAPSRAAPVPLSDDAAAGATLQLADSLEALNRQVAQLGRKDREALARRAGAHGGDAASEIRRARAALSMVQGQMVFRVRRSIWLLAILSCAAVLSFEIYVELQAYAWTRWFSIAYSGLVATAILIYWHAGRQRWQRIAEDYRAAAEALRVQLVWWASGLAARAQRVDAFYLRGAHGSLAQLRALVEHLADAALIRCAPPPADEAAAGAWVESQLEFFDSRIAARQRELAVVEGASWFLFGASLAVGACLALMQLTSTLPHVLMAPSHWRASTRLVLALGGAVTDAGLLVIATRARARAEEEAQGASSGATTPVWAAGLLAGVVLAFTLCDVAAMASGATPDGRRLADTLRWAKELIALAIILPAAIAGALRFVADKSSWAAELSGYEHAREHFRRGRRALAEARGEDRQAVLMALGVEALGENETWLRAHRERPLEPVVGG